MKKDSLTIEWKPPVDDGGVEITKYIVEKCEPQKGVWIKVVEVNREILTCSIQKLQQNSQYIFRVIAENAIGQSEPLESEIVVIKKEIVVPSPPLGPVEFTGMTDTSFTLSWHPSENDGGGEIIEYIVEIKETKKTEWTLYGNTNGNVTHIHIEKVIKDCSYDFRIYARNEVGKSLPLVSEGEITVGQKLSKNLIKILIYYKMLYNF